MANQRIDQLSAETTPAAADLLPLFSISGSDTKKITLKNLVQQGAALIDDGSIPSSKVNLGAGAIVLTGVIVNTDINANAEIAVSKLADGSARQLLQTDSAGTGVEWASNIDIPGTLDITGAATFDSTVAVTGALTKSGSNVVTVGDTGTVTSAMILNDTIVDADISATAEISVSKLADGSARQLLQTDAAGTGVEWASNIDIPGTLDVTSAATFDSTVAVTGALTKSGSNVVTVADTGTVTSTMLLDGTILDADISATAEISVSKLVDGAPRQLLQTDSAGTGVEWASNIDIPGTLDVTSAATFDSSVAVTGALTKSGNNVVTVGDTGTIVSAMLLDGTILDADINASAEIAVSKLADGAPRQLLQTDAAGTGVEWASNIDIPGTLDVTNAATFDSTVAVTGALTKSGSNVVTVGDTGTVISAMLLDGTILNADINDSAAIAYSKLAPLTSGNIILGNNAGIASSIPVTGDISISNTGVTAISSGVIVNADINASAAIVDTKLDTIATAGKISNSATTASSANLASAIVARDANFNFTAGTITASLTGTASGNLVSGGALGTPSSGTLTSCTGLPISTGVSGLGTGAATFLATPSSANLAALLTDETGTGATVFATSPTLVSPALGTPSSGVLTNCTNLPVATSSVVGAVSIPAAGGLALTGGGALSHSNAVAGGASTRSGITYDLQGHIVSTVAIVASDLPAATIAVKGAVIAGTGLAVDGNGILSTSVATTSALGGIKIGDEFGLNGSNQLLLAVQANVAGGTAYPKVTVNSKGVVTAGAALAAGDIPNLDASKITTGSVDIARIAANTITGAKVANYAVTKIGDTQPTADHIGQFFFNPLSRDLFLWDGNVFQPIGISVGEIVFAGTYDCSAGGGTGHVASVTSEGTAVGLVQGSPLPTAATANNRYYLVVSEAGTITSGNAPNVALSPPDIILSTGLIWTEVDVSQTFTSVSASQVAFTPEGTITAANVQSAIEEVNNEKLGLAGGTITGTLEIGTTGSLSFEGSTANSFETSITAVDPTADRTITFPNISGTVITTGDTGTVTSTMLLDGTIVDADVNASAAIAYSKLATLTSGNILVGSSAGIATSTAVSGDVTISNLGVTAIATGVIVNTDINASAAIAGSKIVAATTSAVGAVQLSDSTSTTSSVLAATPTAVKAAYDLAAAALPLAGGTLTGNVILDNQVDARFREATANGTNYVGFQAPATIAADVLWTLPASDGTSAQVLSTNGSGTLSWATAASGDVTLTGAQTLTNKTLTSPILTTPALGTPSSGTLTNCTFPTLNQSTTGNASTATTLATARNIQGVSFDGSAAITVVTAGSGISVTGTAVANTGVLSVNSSTGAITSVAKTDTAQSFTAAQRGTISALTDGATITADFAVANNFSVTLGGSRTLANPSNQTAGQSGCIWITQDGTGSRTLAYGSQWDFTGGTAPTLSTAAASVDCLVYAVQSSTKITATLISNLS